MCVPMATIPELSGILLQLFILIAAPVTDAKSCLLSLGHGTFLKLENCRTCFLQHESL